MQKDVEIIIHEDFRQFFRTAEADFPGLEAALVTDFTAYAQSNGEKCPDYFGRDSIYNWPYAAERAKLRKIQICLPPDTFNPNHNQVDRTTPLDRPDLDAVLVYAQHEFFEFKFLLLNFLHPDGHGQGREEHIMKHLAYIAQAFQEE